MHRCRKLSNIEALREGAADDALHCGYLITQCDLLEFGLAEIDSLALEVWGGGSMLVEF